MSDNIKQIAQRIRELREIAGLTAESLAEEFNIPSEDYKKFESGATDIPVSFLYAVSQRFNVELTALLTGGEPHLHNYCLVRKDEGLSAERRKEYKYQDLAFNFSNKKAETFLVTVEPKTTHGGQHYYAHPGQEFNYVLEGSLQVVLDGHEMVLGPGDSLYFNSGIRHAMNAMHGKPAKFLAIIL